MTRHRILRSLLICTAALATANCAAVQRHLAWFHAAPKVAPRMAAPSADVVKAAYDDGLYGDAVKAIDHRDYGSALELLQAARERAPGDVRVLNAFGVVYDKLGRFDLSGGYYAQAAALDPGSTIVANNESYSRVLQARAAASTGLAAPAEVQTASAAPTPALPAVKPAPAIITVAAAAPVAPKAPAFKPEPLKIAPVFTAAIETVSYRFDALQAPRLPAVLFESEPEAAPAAMTPPTMTPGPRPLPLVVAAPETVSLETVAYTPTEFDRSSALEDFQAEPQAPLPSIAPAVVAALQTADALAPQAGRVVSDGRGRLKLVPGTRHTAPAPTPVLAYAPQAVMTFAGSAPHAAAGPALLASGGRIIEVSPGVLRLEGAPHPMMVALARAPGLTGYPLAVIDASGRVDGAKVTITRLASLGWTARIAPPTPSRQHSTIYYQAGDIEVAQGLARTLAIPVQLAACGQGCRGVTLVVGADALDRATGKG